MTTETPQDDQYPGLVIADFYPRFGALLARRHESGYDEAAGRARFRAWLDEHVDQDRADRALTDYLARVVQEPPVTPAEEAELAQRVRAGNDAAARLAGSDGLAGEVKIELERTVQDGRKAAQRLLEGNLRLVVSLAERFTGRGVPFPDLVQGGSLGLIQAIDKYDHTKGIGFAAYATWWIRQGITRSAAIGAPRLSVSEAREMGAGAIDRMERAMAEILGRAPTPEELAAELDWPAASP